MLLLKHTLRYLIRTDTHGIIYQDTYGSTLTPYADADYATSVDLRSIYVHIHVAFGAPISWASNKHPSIALSTCEVDYLAARHGIQESLRLRRIIADIMPIRTPKNTPIQIDKQNYVMVVRNQSKNENIKHLETRAHHLNHHQQHKFICVTHIPTQKIYSYILTRIRQTTSFNRFNMKLIFPTPSVAHKPLLSHQGI